jgi:hypothetical protein
MRVKIHCRWVNPRLDVSSEALRSSRLRLPNLESEHLLQVSVPLRCRSLYCLRRTSLHLTIQSIDHGWRGLQKCVSLAASEGRLASSRESSRPGTGELRLHRHWVARAAVGFNAENLRSRRERRGSLIQRSAAGRPRGRAGLLYRWIKRLRSSRAAAGEWRVPSAVTVRGDANPNLQVGFDRT